MKTTGSLAAFAATAAAQQFVLYATGDESSAQRADPIVAPGELSAHVHDFLGAGAFEPELSYESLQNTDCTTVGAADGTGIAQDNSVYWHPSLYAPKKDGSGYMKVPTIAHKMYYRKPAANKYVEPFDFPTGWRMVAGDPQLRGPSNVSTMITEWKCFGSGGTNIGEDGGFPQDIGACDAYPGFMGTLHFPHCWNGEDFNQDDPYAHFAYPEGDVQSGNCPSSHPTAVPHIFMENLFDIKSVYDEIDTSGLILSNGDTSGCGWHGDMFNGWEKGALAEIFDTCPQGQYGNHDVGQCPSYKSRSTKGSDCKLKKYFEEDVEEPGSNLCGCNPISTENPAPKMETAKLGQALAQCALKSAGGSSGGDAPSYEPPTASGVMSILPVPSSPAAPATTFATAPSAAAPAPTYGGSWGSPDSYVDSASTEEEPEYDEDGYEIEYVTEWVTATAQETTYVNAKRDYHNHMQKHKRRNF